MMCLVLGHGAKPLPRGDRGPGRRHALAVKVGVAERTEHGEGLGVAPLHVRTYAGNTRGEGCRVARTAARTPRHVLRVHEALDACEMPKKIAEGEATRGVGPLEIGLGKAVEDAGRTRTGVGPVVRERGDVFHHEGLQGARIPALSVS